LVGFESLYITKKDYIVIISVGTLDVHMHLVFPALIRLFRVEASVDIRRHAIRTLTKLIPRVQVCPRLLNSSYFMSLYCSADDKHGKVFEPMPITTILFSASSQSNSIVFCTGYKVDTNVLLSLYRFFSSSTNSFSSLVVF
jgi:hypothetical protein